MWASLLGCFCGFLTLGHITPLPSIVLYVSAFILLLCFLLSFWLRQGSLTSVNIHRISSFCLLSGQFLLALVLSASYANQKLAVQLKQTRFQPQQITTAVRVVGISQSVGERVRQVVSPISVSSAAIEQVLPNKWLLKSAYGSDSHIAINQMRAGEVWQVTATVMPPHGVAGEGLFSEQKWLLGMQVGAIALASEMKLSKLVTEKEADVQKNLSFTDTLANYRLSLRHHLSNLTTAEKYHQDKAVLLALLTGDTALINSDTKKLYQRTGISHLLAISGPHVLFAAGLFAWILVRILNRFPRVYRLLPKLTLVMPFALTVAIGYALLSGWELPAQRTVYMFAIATGLALIKVPWSFWKVMLVSACVILCIEPLSVLSAAFWLSFVAVGLLVLLEQGSYFKSDSLPSIKRIFSNRINDYHDDSGRDLPLFKIIMTKFQLFMILQVMFFVCIFPISLVFFGEVSWLTPFTNLIAIPLLGSVIVPLNIVAFLVSFVSADLAGWLWQGLIGLLHLFHAWLAWLVKIVPDVMLSVALDKTALWACALMVILSLLRFFGRIRWLILPLFVLIVIPKKLPSPASITVMDGTSFSAVLVKSRIDKTMQPHKNLLYISDINKKSSLDYEITKVILPSLQAMNVTELDKLIVSQGSYNEKDPDKINANKASQANVMVKDVIQLLQSGLDIKEVLTNIPDDRIIDIPQTNMQLTKCRAGEQWQWGQAKFEMLSPWQDVPISGNDASCVLKVSVPANKIQKNEIEHSRKDTSKVKNSVLLMGNASQLTQKMILALCQHAKADVMMLPQQGSKSSHLAQFIDKVQPSHVFVGKHKGGFSAEFNKGKQSPHLVTRAYLQNNHIHLDTTRQGGALTYRLGDDSPDHGSGNSMSRYRDKLPWLRVD